VSRPAILPADSRAATAPRLRLRVAGRAPLGLVALAMLLFLALGARLIDVGAADLGIAGLFSTDEKLAGELVRAMVRGGNLELSHFFSYGPLNLYAARLLLWIYGAFRPVTDELILVALRLISLAAGTGCVYLTYLLGRRLWGSWIGALGAAIVALSTTVLAWSTTAHPDMPQLFWLLLGLLWTVKLAGRPSRTSVAVAAICAALAFASKYTGELLLPLLWVASLLGHMHASGGPTLRFSRQAAMRSLQDVALSAAVFLLVFLAVDPSVVVERASFFYQARLEASLAHGGHLLAVSPSPFGWLRTLAGREVIGPLFLILGVAGVVAFTLVPLRTLVMGCGTPRRAAPRLILSLWTAGYLLVLVVWIGDLQPRYALPALPGLALLGSALVVQLAKIRPVPAATAILAGGIVICLATQTAPLLQYERAQASRMQSPGIRDQLAAGEWLKANAKPDTRILADAYSYIPPGFSNAEETFSLTQAQIRQQRPRLIITESAIRDRFLDPALASRYADGPAAYLEIERTYQELEAGGMGCYPLLKRFGGTAIYGRLGSETCEPT
jgi:4-amino-4-deoxy-L-arabinose transferase-like glycosyltransferase